MTDDTTIMGATRALGESVERMIAIQMEAYPSHWPEADRREMAERVVLGEGRP